MLNNNGIILIIMRKPIADNWGNNELNRGHHDFNVQKWKKKKIQLKYWKYNLLYNYNSILYESFDKYIFIVQNI
jgi:hypothetical protein